MGTLNSTPFVLSSQASIGVTANVLDVPFAALGLTNFVNSLSVPIEATELSVIVSASGENTLTYDNLNKVEIDLKIGRWGITNGFCPVRALGPRRETVQLENAIALVTSGAAISDTRWIFPRPLIVGPRESFTGNVRISPDVTAAGTGTITVTTVIRARRYDGQMPKSRLVPYASGAFYTSAAFLPPTRTFGNIFRVPLNVASINACDEFGSLASFAATDTISIVGPGGLSNTVRRSMASLAPIRGVFTQQLAIEEATVLLPDEFFQITGNYSAATVPSAGNPLAIVMSGYREEN